MQSLALVVVVVCCLCAANSKPSALKVTLSQVLRTCAAVTLQSAFDKVRTTLIPIILPSLQSSRRRSCASRAQDSLRRRVGSHGEPHRRHRLQSAPSPSHATPRRQLRPQSRAGRPARLRRHFRTRAPPPLILFIFQVTLQWDYHAWFASDSGSADIDISSTTPPSCASILPPPPLSPRRRRRAAHGSHRRR
jgi:hypothetical protein